MVKPGTQSEEFAHASYETGEILVSEGGSMCISIPALAMVAIFVEIARLWHPNPESVARQHLQSKGWL